MNLIKFSFYYIASYLGLAGVAFLLFPTQFQRLLFANQIYDTIPMNIAGMFALLLSIVVFQLARKGLFELYSTTLFARAVALIIIIYLYIQTRNPFFISMFSIVSLGVILTLIGHYNRNKTPVLK
ncbi:MAG: hypothetical protein WCK91_01355 [bacterium]